MSFLNPSPFWTTDALRPFQRGARVPEHSFKSPLLRNHLTRLARMPLAQLEVGYVFLGWVIAPSEEEDTVAAYLAKTPVR